MCPHCLPEELVCGHFQMQVVTLGGLPHLATNNSPPNRLTINRGKCNVRHAAGCHVYDVIMLGQVLRSGCKFTQRRFAEGWLYGLLDEVIALPEQSLFSVLLQPKTPNQDIGHFQFLHWSRDPLFVRWPGACTHAGRRLFSLWWRHVPLARIHSSES